MVVCNFRLEKPTGHAQTYRTRRSYRIKWQTPGGKDVRKTFAESVATLIRGLLESTEDAEVEWKLLGGGVEAARRWSESCSKQL